MKRIVYCLAILGLTFVGCNPMDDIYDGLDTSADPIVGSESYTLTSDDYTELDLEFGNFGSEEDAKTILPGFLAEKYPFWGEGSSVVVGYDLFIGNAEGINDYTNSDVYEFTNSNYAATGSDAFGFYPDVNATSAIPEILDAQIADPTEGQIVLAKYDQYTETPVVGLADLVAYNFAGSLQGWNIVEENGDYDVWSTETGNIRGNGYFDGDQRTNAEWLVSPSIDLSDESDLKFQITQELDFAGDASLVKILVSTDYTDDVFAATWDEITLAMPATEDMASSENYDFSAYDGEIINIAFMYSSIGDDESTPDVDEGDASRWRIASMAIKTTGATGDTNSKGEYFMYASGAWSAIDGVYYLSSADFDSMGEGSGQPGQYDNFSSSISPDNYLPTFLSLNFPYAQEEEELVVIYDYYSSSSGAQRRGNLYTVTNGEFVGHESTVSRTLQFGFEDGVWIPDNTIRYTLSADDYTVIGAALADTYPNATSSMLNYGNMDRRAGNTAEWTNPMVLEAINVVLDNNVPSAAEEQKYVVTIEVYNGSNTTEDFAVIKMNGEWVYQD
ncbi:choice-of-anchor J domain-containing protein [Winogradskyella bathintestinalis]|uniref:Choice-of-anchor J domain-containing protein n=1 Tax=Winogradskyella bathintestinalis TaxID=3035208 RepID=A0ABT7ZS25_9FLAO|nr:choice-of-anchor J domain-containing protein [Winogradskyella bathintestinalis]MDN3491815.1 choice-of-anchor J domain-containing protein [Winogradskyella bathintestinalis]